MHKFSLGPSPTAMHQHSRILTLSGFGLLIAVSVGLTLAFILAPYLSAHRAGGLRLGPDLPMQQLVDRGGHLGINQVAALPDTAFTQVRAPLNQGYTHAVYWLKVAPPPTPAGSEARWLELHPTYLDRVTLYQSDGDSWREHNSGDTVSMADRVRVRQPMFPLIPGQPFILRIQTTSAMQLYGTVWQETPLMARLATVEWSSGLYMGICLVLVTLISAAALAFHSRSLGALAVLAAVGLVHGANVRGYAQLWLPDSLGTWNDTMVSVGAFVLAATLPWQTRELLTRGTKWRHTDRALLLLVLLSLASLASVPLNRYNDWAWVGVASPWLASVLGACVAWGNLRRHGACAERTLIFVPYAIHSVLGAQLAAAFVGWVPSNLEASVFWQLEALVFYTLITIAAGVGLVQKFRDSAAAQAQLVESLAKSEHALEERVRVRTVELIKTQNALQAALHSEREMRLDQRQFFNMVNHEFRTPLAVVDSAATEQLSFPSTDIDAQTERAAQIRRACRRLTALVDNCLINDRLDNSGFRLQLVSAPVQEIMEEAAQLVRWSPRHRLHLFTEGAPTEWVCDPTLVRIALSNLVDNAVKYAQSGEIFVAAHRDPQGALQLSVADEGPGLPPDAVQRLFEQFERGHRTDQTKGFGLGLWVSRRVARLHGGDVRVESSTGHGTCFTLTLPLRTPSESILDIAAPTMAAP